MMEFMNVILGLRVWSGWIVEEAVIEVAVYIKDGVIR